MDGDFSPSMEFWLETTNETWNAHKLAFFKSNGWLGPTTVKVDVVLPVYNREFGLFR